MVAAPVAQKIILFESEEWTYIFLFSEAQSLCFARLHSLLVRSTGQSGPVGQHMTRWSPG